MQDKLDRVLDYIGAALIVALFIAAAIAVTA